MKIWKKKKKICRFWFWFHSVNVLSSLFFFSQASIISKYANMRLTGWETSQAKRKEEMRGREGEGGKKEEGREECIKERELVLLK